MSAGKVICVVGKTGEGKTTYIKNFSTNKIALCYLRIESDFDGKKVTKFTNFPLFLRTANKKKDIVCYIDEAFTCLPDKLNIKMDKPNDPHNQLADFLVSSRKMNRFVFIILHSLSQIPSKWLIPYLDYLVRFETNDQLQYQIKRFSSYPEIVDSLIKNPKIEKYKPIILKLR